MGAYTTPAELDMQDQPWNPSEAGVDVAAETVTPKGASQRPETAPADYGPNNETLPEVIQKKLVDLVVMARRDAPRARREEIARIQQARSFWKDLQYGYSDREGNWHLVDEVRGDQIGESEAEVPRYQFVTNYYQAFGLSLMAVLSSQVPPTKLWPQDPDQPEDRATAEGGQDVIELVERNNRISLKLSEEAYLLYTDGKVGGFVRYVVDGQRFGFHTVEEMEPRLTKLGEDAYQCPQCGAETPATGAMGGVMCLQCGAELNDDNLSPAPLVEVPNITQVHQVPNGQEVLSIYGGLELKTPPRCNDQNEFPYILLENEVYRARLRSAYKHVRDKLKRGGGESNQGDVDGARSARLEVTGGSQEDDETLITYCRAWLRPWWFENLENADKPEQDLGGKSCIDFLKDLFPTGCYVAIAGDVYCESRNETMDDCWRVMHALPGDGQDRPAVGTSFVQVQERINTLDNILMETAEYGIPATFMDTALMSTEAWQQTVTEPGATYPVDRPNGTSLSDCIHQTQPLKLPEHIGPYSKDLATDVGQFLTGAMPALFGGEQTSVDTMGGQQLKHQEALGRIGLVWRRMIYFHADLMMLAVDVFRKNRPEDVKLAIHGDGGEWKSKMIRTADLKGNIFAYPDTDEQYPSTLGQKQAALDKLMMSKDPKVLEVLSHPDNMDFFKRLSGLRELVLPEDEARRKQYREIEELLAAAPVQAPTMELDPVSQQPVQRMTLEPSVPVDAELDMHQAEFEVCQRWVASEIGQRAKMENPMGFANVRAHALQHLQAMQQKMMQAQAMAAAAGGEASGEISA